ncbi:MAG: hypothetical protein AseanaTS_17410 [Candidatus Pelagadaptatus aseana]|uniref:hypothetical protein n=1 Tax=Candidatus Pelagadaptatus aseana TaxID=3120508 RepID=UPI0039B23DEC
MMTRAELITTLISGVGVVSMTVMATLYWAGEAGRSTSNNIVVGAISERQLYELSDAFFTCRDQIGQAVPYKVRNINVDSHSSRYQQDKNAHFVVIDLEVVEKPGSFYSKSNYDAKIYCQVSAASNEVTSFRMTRG